MLYRFPKFKAAAVQCAPVYLDREATTEKACGLIKAAARNGARLVAFPEAFIPGYPHWIWLNIPEHGERFFSQLVKNSVAVPSPTTDKLCQVAREHQVYVVIGVNESSPYSFAEVFNTGLLIGPNGRIIGVHRKIMPTYAEKLVWSFGDGSTLRVHETELGRIGMLLCGENGNSLARFALIAQAEQIHVSNYPAYPQRGHYDLKRAIEIRAAAHSFEAKVFNIVSSSLIDDEMKQLLGDTPEKKEVLANGSNVFTGIIGPDGRVLAGPLPDDEEGIAYADIDLEQCIKWKLFHDIAGNYNRFDVVSLNLNRQARKPIHETHGNLGGRAVDPDIASRLQGKLHEIEDEALRSELQALVGCLLARADA